jgi:hypothetical protein
LTGPSGYVRPMQIVFDLSDRIRLPGRFYGAAHSALARR